MKSEAHRIPEDEIGYTVRDTAIQWKLGYGGKSFR